ncbi:12184_t:CDS:1, partial [Racocetra persica]
SISDQIPQVPAINTQLTISLLQNKLSFDGSGISQAEVESMINPLKSTQSASQERQLTRPSKMEPGKIYYDPNLRLNDQEYFHDSDVLERLNSTAKGGSFFQNLINMIEKISNQLSKGKKDNTSSTDGIDRITK